jgi:hypothetical protein
MVDYWRSVGVFIDPIRYQPSSMHHLLGYEQKNWHFPDFQENPLDISDLAGNK